MRRLHAHLLTRLTVSDRQRGASSLEALLLIVGLIAVATLIVAAVRGSANSLIGDLPG